MGVEFVGDLLVFALAVCTIAQTAIDSLKV